MMVRKSFLAFVFPQVAYGMQMHGLYFQVRAGTDSRYAASFIARFFVIVVVAVRNRRRFEQPLYLSVTADPPHVTEISTSGDLI